jgi:aconitate hydratase
MKSAFRKALTASVKEAGFGVPAAEAGKQASVEVASKGQHSELGHGALVIAAITSCTNTSNPSVLIAAGLLAKRAVEAGLHVAPHVKTSLAPGSRVVSEYLQAAGLLHSLEQVGYNIVGYGCTTCIGNSGPLPEEIDSAVAKNQLVAAAVLSGNRNFEGRIHPRVKANYLASPPLVVAYALAGTVDRDLTSEPLGTGKNGQPVYLRDIWPSQAEVSQLIEKSITPEMFKKTYSGIFTGNADWNAVGGAAGSAPVVDLYKFDPSSTYIQEPPFFSTMQLKPEPIRPIRGARVLCLLGDSVTTDHISPAGDISEDSPAAEYLRSHGIKKVDFNSYGARRGNDRVMVRGTFANIRLKNLLLPGVEGGYTIPMPDGERMSIFAAAEHYKKAGIPLVVIAGKEYGTGSSRDWAAKGTLLLGVRAVIAESFERIHRANLVGMGVLPLVFEDGQNAEKLGLNGHERYSIELPVELKPRQTIKVQVERDDGSTLSFNTRSRLDTPIDVRYYQNGGILHTVLRDLIARGE